MRLLGVLAEQRLVARFVLASAAQTAAAFAVLVQVPRVILHLKHILHFAQAVKPQMRPVGVFLSVVGEKRGLTADDGHNRLHSALLEQRIGVNVVVVVAVIEGDHHRLLRQVCTVLHIRQQITYRYGGISLHLQGVQIGRQNRRRDNIFALPCAVLENAVIH